MQLQKWFQLYKIMEDKVRENGVVTQVGQEIIKFGGILCAGILVGMGFNMYKDASERR